MTQETRRRALKGLAITVPAAWTAPIVYSVILPAHAQMSLISATIDCNMEDTEGFCQPSAFDFRVFGTVAGGDLAGAVLEIEFTDGTFTDTDTTTVQSDNPFDESVVATPPPVKAGLNLLTKLRCVSRIKRPLVMPNVRVQLTVERSTAAMAIMV